MIEDPAELLSAFLDGENVEPVALAEALSSPGAREALRDYALLRARVRADTVSPGAAFYEAMERALGSERRARFWEWSWIRVPAPAFAALVVTALGLGIWAGFGLQRGTKGNETPPRPDRVVRFETGVDWKAL